MIPAICQQAVNFSSGGAGGPPFTPNVTITLDAGISPNTANLTVTVDGEAGAATGNVSLYCLTGNDGFTNGNFVGNTTLSAGVGAFAMVYDPPGTYGNKKVFSDAEIFAQYNGNATYYPANNTANVTCTLRSDSGNVALSTWPLSANCDDTTANLHGVASPGVSFSGAANLTDGYVNLGRVQALEPANDFTIAGWIQPHANSGTVVFGFVTAGQVGASEGLSGVSELYGYLSSGAMRINAGGTSGAEIDSNTTFPVDEWTHFAICYWHGNNTIAFYGNGNIASGFPQSYTRELTANSTFQLRLGYPYNVGKYDGLMSDFAVYNYALDDSQVAALYASQPH